MKNVQNQIISANTPNMKKKFSRIKFHQNNPYKVTKYLYNF